MTNSNRKARALGVENLENRELMAADIGSAGMVGSTLVVTGTDNRDDIRIVQSGSNVLVYNQNKYLWGGASSEIQSVQAILKSGNDRVTMNLNQMSLDQIYVDLGKGSGDIADLRIGNVNNLAVNAVASLGSLVQLQGTVKATASVDFGTDAANDTFATWSSTINNLDLKMGGGNDLCTIRKTSVASANINLGSGDDRFINDASAVDSGTIDGGSGANKWSGAKFGKAVKVKGF